jgi:hypothetical protein
MAKQSPAAQNKIHKVMHEWKHGQLHSGSKDGPKVKNPKQAVAIAMSEARSDNLQVDGKPTKDDHSAEESKASKTKKQSASTGKKSAKTSPKAAAPKKKASSSSRKSGVKKSSRKSVGK